MARGNTEINGPHQGAWVSTSTGEDWFIHFQDKNAYGRIVHLQPLVWTNDWPVIGNDADGDGVGEPVLTHKKPKVEKNYPVVTPPESDEMNGNQLGLQWQWHANQQITWGFPSGNLGFYRLNCIPSPENSENLWNVPNLLLQKFPAEEFTATAKLDFTARTDNEELGFLVMGEDYQFISIQKSNGKLWIKTIRCKNARTGGKEEELYLQEINSGEMFFRIKVEKGAICTFQYSTDGNMFVTAGPAFEALPGRWIGAKVGFFALREGITNDAGSADIDWFRIEK